MATVYVTEFQSGCSGIGSMVAQLLPQPPVAQQNLTVSSSSNPSAPFNANTNAIELYSDVDFTFVVAALGVPIAAITGGNRVKAGERLRYAVPPGGAIAVIT